MSTGAPPLIGALDAGTTSVRFSIFDCATGQVASSNISSSSSDVNRGKRLFSQHEFTTANEKPGWAAQDPAEIAGAAVRAMDDVYALLDDEQRKRVRGVGIANQRETTVAWDRATGEPLCPAIVWHDVRTQKQVDDCIAMAETLDRGEREAYFRRVTGLPPATYFSAFKMMWMLEHEAKVKAARDAGTLMFGTVDSWLVWYLTGGRGDGESRENAGVHVTDVTNASRMCLMDLAERRWDERLCQFFAIPQTALPKIASSAEVYGPLRRSAFANLDVPISGILGDQQAALVGQGCFNTGEAKNTYGTGCFMLFVTGSVPVPSTHGLLTTTAFQLGPDQPTVYALEGSIAIAGVAVTWLRDNMGIISSAAECTELARTVEDTGGCFFVPAFSGLFAPHWRPDARGTIVGLTQYTTKAHLCRATLDAPCFQTREVMDAMQKDSGSKLAQLKVDGGMTHSDIMLQRQADVLGIDILHGEPEATSRGAFLAAAVGCGALAVEGSTAEGNMTIPLVADAGVQRTTQPGPGQTAAAGDFVRWGEAVKRSFGWATDIDRASL
jgi:glycerol kinase